MINNNLKNIIDKLLNKILPKFDIGEKNLIGKTLVKIILLIGKKFNINNNELIIQFTYNKNQDIISLLLTIFPFIRENNSFEKFQESKNFKDLIYKKKNNENYSNSNKDKQLYENSTIAYDLGIIHYNSEPFTFVEDDLNLARYLYNTSNLLINTIENIYYKCSINWINIFPISILDENNTVKYKESKLWQGTYRFDYTLNKFNKDIEWFDNEKKTNYDYNGIPISEVYNTFVNYYYLSMSEIEFFLDYINEGNEKYTYIEYIKKVCKDLYENLDKKINYQALDFKAKTKIETFFNTLKQKDDKLFKTIIKNFEQKYQKFNNIKDYKPYKKEQKNYKIPFIELYDYLLYCFNHFRLTPHYFILSKRDGDVLFTNLNNPYNNLNLDLRNLYDFGKYLHFLYYIKDDNEQPSSNWDNLDNNEKDDLCNWYNNIDAQISNKNFSHFKNLKYFNEIFKYIKTISFDLTFETLLRLGFLTEYKFNLDMLVKDNKKLKEEEKRIMKKIDKEKYVYYQKIYQNNYYYLTNDKFKDIKFKIAKKDKNYFELLGKKEWYTKYAFNWIFQISFYYKYINKRVILITGGTGQGKSVYAPRLIIYSGKILDYNLYNKIYITQPRIAPVRSNTKFIAEDMDVPIYDRYFKDNTDFRSENGMIQYQYAKDNHINENNMSYLRTGTDGKLFSQLTSNILLKDKFIRNKKTNEFKYLNNNIYDSIVIDECHEHNKNMDYILSVLKQSLLFNTSLRLFIVSATLESDEHRYREFYKIINDNFKYPFNVYNYNNMFDRIYIDRRIDITPPNSLETQYKITEFYHNKEPNDEKEATNIGIDKVLDIINQTDSGEILFFTYSIKEAIKICELLNNKIPSNVLAIPFFSKLKKKYRNIISETLDKNRNEFNIDKDIIIDVLLGNYDEKIIYNRNYDRIIIVATNIAEASITINTLKYVVDIGYELNIINDVVNKISKPEITKITESSRKQRKGRVGRKTSGTVYYTYTEGSREPIKKKFDITISDLSSDILRLISDNYLTLDLFKYLNFYKNYFDFEQNNQILIKNLSKFKFMPETQIFMKQFLLRDDKNSLKILPMDKEIYLSYKSMFKYYTHRYKNYFTIYDKGFDLEKILDPYGIFYIIHPDENNFKRSTRTGEIIKDDDLDENKINKNLYFYKQLINNNYIFNLNKKHNLNLEIIEKELPKSQLIKSKIFNVISDIEKYFESLLEEFPDGKFLIFYGLLYNCIDDILKIIAGLIICSNLSDIYADFDMKKKDIRFKNVFKNKFGDVYAFIDIINYFNKININNYEIIKQNYSKTIIKKSDDIKDYEDNPELWNNKIICKIANTYSKDPDELQKICQINSNISNSNYFNFTKLHLFENYCKNYHINYEKAYNIILIYLRLFDVYEEMKNIEEQNEYNIFEKLKLFYVEKSNDNNINIEKCLIATFIQNITELKKDKYINLRDNNILENNKISFKDYESILTNINRYQIFIKKDNIKTKNDTFKISFIHNISNIGFLFEESFNLFNINNLILNNDINFYFLNFYSTKYLNNKLVFIKKNNRENNVKYKDKIISNNFFENLLKYDKIYKINDLKDNKFDVDYYRSRIRIINNINYYYYYLQNMLKN